MHNFESPTIRLVPERPDLAACGGSRDLGTNPDSRCCASLDRPFGRIFRPALATISGLAFSAVVLLLALDTAKAEAHKQEARHHAVILQGVVPYTAMPNPSSSVMPRQISIS